MFVAPALALIGLFLVFPAIWTIYLGMTDYRLTGFAAVDPEFVGLDNYARILGDPTFWRSLRLTLVFVLVSGIIGQSLLGFAVAWALRRITGWAKTLIETLVLAAWVVPASVASFLWIALLDRREGTLNEILGTTGMAWLIEYPMASIIVFNIWVGTAFSMLLFSSALAAVPPSQLESARMAGATGWQQLRDVVIPNIRGHILTNTLLITLWTFNTFTPYLVTAGGPNGESEIIAVYIYNTAIPGGQLGVGAAISLIMLLINLVVALGYLRVGRARGARPAEASAAEASAAEAGPTEKAP
ncbi:binding-protein-dependent transport systems inner membrane component [Beutenbergia cavernae DSM 12333]|uniref:Binding-protein-dependent transport systems inner membrane component n=1 Tax=Beutenbergia cavernae (strain ATCC BAA-8 / DSM 12333 / CCUG 43141 / JCM 11478 / NBRC 16432 / NCIMB 13614 / HKI 0122) TaxID=471853 RepID=C5BWY2_BEUC1|nr:binding-protein-dependent transport systems inner membrane component [Beutenbergia cavernae DSM 12333]